jgi:hypothetical protein
LKHFFYILFLFFSIANVQAQEVLDALLENTIQKKYYEEFPPSLSRSGPDTLTLPFLDDFSFSRVSPHDSLWADRFVFVNNNYAVNPPTIGVATFDGLKEDGMPYIQNQPLAVGVADYLTSKPIFMGSLVPADSVYFSFYYQPQGNGNLPQPQDSLVLEFFSPTDSVWRWAWSKSGVSVQSFQAVIIAVTDTAYLKDGFRFRFKNYANLAGSFDHWNIDYVWLDKNRTAAVTIIDDIAFVSEPNPMLSRYREMPWKQYKANPSGEFNNSLTVALRNNFSISKLLTYSFNIYDRAGNLIASKPPTNDNISALSNYSITNTPNLSGSVLPYSSSNAYETFLIENIVSSSGDSIKINDTLRTEIIFDKHYAYDDGSAEMAYGINVAGGKMAMQFDLNTPEPLTGLAIHFSNANENVSNKPFRITVWSNLSTDQIVYQKDSVSYPVYDGRVNGFYYYPIPAAPTLSGTVYIGWVQVTNSILNVGFDKNSNASNKMFFNTGGTWNTSQVNGAWMIRPVFGGTPNFNIGEEELLMDKQEEITVYPNPAKNELHISGHTDNTQIEIYDMYGKLMFKQQIYKNTPLNTSVLKQGMYLLRIIENEEKISIRKISIVQ